MSPTNLTLLPLDRSSPEHVFPKSIIVVREDEPSTIVAAALSSDDYVGKLFEIREQYMVDSNTPDEVVDNEKQANLMDASPADMFIERTLRSKSGIHMKSCKLGGV
jgi:1-phosphatidylinositol-3-phosphate 5-kinase